MNNTRRVLLQAVESQKVSVKVNALNREVILCSASTIYFYIRI